MSENAIVVSDMSLKDKVELAKIFAQSGRFTGDTLPAHAVVKIQAGLELGIPPLQAMTNIHIINGRVSLGAHVMAALIKRSKRWNFKIKTLTNELCELDFYEDGEFVGPSNFSIEDAKLAGLVGKDVWKKFPRNMLYSRAVSNGARWFCAGVFGGAIYTREELEDGNVDAELIETKKSRWQLFIEQAKDEFGLNEEEVKKVLKDNGHTQFNFENWEVYVELLAKNSNVVDGEVS